MIPQEWEAWVQTAPPETRLVHRKGEPITHFPWVRHSFGWSGGDSRVRAYILPGKRLEGKRLAIVNPDDFAEDSPYRIYGDCPIEAILPATFAPGRRPVPAYPVHLILANWWALGVRLHVGDDGRLHWSAKHPLESLIRGTLAAMDEPTREACRIWVASFWAAPEDARWRWIASHQVERDRE